MTTGLLILHADVFLPKKENDKDNEGDIAGQSVFGDQNGAADAGRTQKGSAGRAVDDNPGDSRGGTAGGQERAGISQQSVNNDISYVGGAGKIKKH